ncbi:MAG TPA: RnfH family protein [Zeimonas sp.]
MHVEVAWVQCGRVVSRPLELPAGARVDDALAALGEPLAAALLERIARRNLSIAVYGKPRSRQAALHEGDRIELVGELVLDPKVARRLRVQQRRDKGGDRRWKPR